MIPIMKQIEKISSGAAYSAVCAGKFDELSEHLLVLSPEVQIPGKVFMGSVLNASGAEISFQSFPVGGETGFLHTHKTHEELYIFVKGCGEFQVDGKTFAISEGCVVRVAPSAKRSVINTGDGPLVMICVQYKADSFSAEDANDGVILNEPVVW